MEQTKSRSYRQDYSSNHYRIRSAAVLRRSLVPNPAGGWLTDDNGNRLLGQRWFIKLPHEVRNCEFIRCPYCGAEGIVHLGLKVPNHFEHKCEASARARGCPSYRNNFIDKDISEFVLPFQWENEEETK